MYVSSQSAHTNESASSRLGTFDFLTLLLEFVESTNSHLSKTGLGFLRPPTPQHSEQRSNQHHVSRRTQHIS